MAPSGPKADPKAKAAPEKKPKPVKKEAKPEEDEASKLPVVEKPDPSVFDDKLKEVQDKIESFQKKQGEITNQIKARSVGKEDFFQKKAVVRGQLDELSGKINTLQEQKDGIKKTVGEKQEEGRTARGELTKLKKTIGFTNELEIDERIASIEFKMWTDSVSLKDEKKMLLEIQELKRNRPKVAQIGKKETELAGFDRGLSMKESVADINEQLNVLRDARTKVRDSLTELTAGRQEQLGDLPEIMAQRDELYKQIQEQIQVKNSLRDEKREAERAYNDYQNELRRLRSLRSQDERNKRQQEFVLEKRKRQAEQLDEQPYVSEITLIEQTILWCKDLTKSKAVEKDDVKKDAAVDNPDGCEILVRKEDRDEFYYAPTAKGKKGKAKKAAGDGKKPIKHNAETFKLFDQLKLDAPITTDDIPALLEKLEKQLESFQQKLVEWEKNRDERKRKILAGEEEEKEEKKDAEENGKEGDKTEVDKEEAPAEAKAED